MTARTLQGALDRFAPNHLRYATLAAGLLALAAGMPEARALAQTLTVQTADPSWPPPGTLTAALEPADPSSSSLEQGDTSEPGEIALRIAASVASESNAAGTDVTYRIPYSLRSDWDLRAQMFTGGQFTVLTGQAEWISGDAVHGVRGVRSASAGSGLEQVPPFMAANSTGTLQVAVNPRVKGAGSRSMGSRVWRMLEDGSPQALYTSSDRWVRAAAVEETGRLVGIATAVEGDEVGRMDQVLVTDPHGNPFTVIEPEFAVRRIAFTRDLSHVVTMSQRRVAVHTLPDGERVGRVSMAAEVVQAQFDPDANLIVALTVEGVTVVDLQRRSLKTEPIPGSGIEGEERMNLQRTDTYMDLAGGTTGNADPAWTVQRTVSINRIGSARYRISGLEGRDLIVTYRRSG